VAQRSWHRRGVVSGQRGRIVGRRVAVALVVVVQLGFVVRAYGADHRELGWQMFPEASTWQADIVRVTASGRRVPVESPWDGYRWAELVPSRGLADPGERHHADAGLDNQLAFLDAALDWVATHTPRDRETVYLEATVTYWYNDDDPRVVVLRSQDRT
jgi:hypothetical protein